jgi:hypothetical protein
MAMVKYPMKLPVPRKDDGVGHPTKAVGSDGG